MSVAGVGSILIVEADSELGRELAEQLIADGYSVELARSSEHARILARESPPRVTLLGELDSAHGALRLLEEIRRSPANLTAPWNRDLPAIVICPRAHELTLLRAFEAGADDFLARPASYLELRARLRALLRRAEGPRAAPRLFEVGPLAIDLAAHAASLDGRVLALRRREFDLLAHLAADPNRVFSTDELLRSVWGYRASGSTRTVASHASRLRSKLEAGCAGRWVVNVRGVGYRLR